MDGIVALIVLVASVVAGYAKISILACAIIALFSLAAYYFVSVSSGRWARDAAISASSPIRWISTHYVIHLLASVALYGLGRVLVWIFG